MLGNSHSENYPLFFFSNISIFSYPPPPHPPRVVDCLELEVGRQLTWQVCMLLHWGFFFFLSVLIQLLGMSYFKLLHYEMSSVYLLILSFCSLPVDLIGIYSFFHFLQWHGRKHSQEFSHCITLPLLQTSEMLEKQYIQ